jgi:hypothetical protein
MLKTVISSSNKKTGPIAVTYRAGENHVFGSCPKQCALNPNQTAGADKIDLEYLEALRRAVPRNGQAWTYSHFSADQLPEPKEGETVINFSADKIADALGAVKNNRPAVYAAPLDAGDFPQTHAGVQFVQCPAEKRDSVTCASCGNGRPLCARGSRDYVIVFTAHGNGKKKVGAADAGGCYAASGPVMLQWKRANIENDAQALVKFAKSLPYGWMLRHHVAGDIGRG